MQRTWVGRRWQRESSTCTCSGYSSRCALTSSRRVCENTCEYCAMRWGGPMASWSNAYDGGPSGRILDHGNHI